MKIFRIAAIVIAASPFFACAAATDSADGEPAASESAAAVTVVAKSPCPTSAPRPKSACSDANLLCSYGNDTRFGCRDVLNCQSGEWLAVGTTCTKKVPSCPEKAPKLADGGISECTTADLGMTCTYAHEAYTCASCAGNLCRAEGYWQTTALPTACPAAEPNFGQTCSAASGTRCSYNPCANDGDGDLGAAMTCTSGVWTAYTGQICF